MTTYGVTATGFVTKILSVIVGELEVAMRAIFGQGIDLSAESPLGQLVGIMAEREALLWGLAEGVYNASYVDTAEGVQLDNIAALAGIKRKDKTFSKLTGVIFGGTAATFLAKGRVANVAGNALARFLTDADMTIAAAVIEVQHVAFNHVPTGGGPWTLGGSGKLAYNANAAAVQTALRLLTGLGSVTVAGDYTAGFDVTFTGTVGPQTLLAVAGSTLTWASGNVTVTVTKTTVGVPPQVIGSMTAESAGPVIAPATSLTVIATPVAGWATVSNPTDAVVGSAIEIDPAFKLRRASSTQRTGGGSIPGIFAKVAAVAGVTAVEVFENTTLTTDGNGRPGKCFECVVENGADADIAAAIFGEKAGGMQAYGGTTVAVVDSQGVSHNVSFTRPTGVNIYVEADLTVSAAYPAGGDAAVAALLLAYGNALGLASTIIPSPAMIAAINSVPGILTAVIKIGTAPSPTLSNNITMTAYQLPVFDSSRIAVVS